MMQALRWPVAGNLDCRHPGMLAVSAAQIVVPMQPFLVLENRSAGQPA